MSALNSLQQPEPNAATTERRSPLFEQAVAVTRAYADRLQKHAALLALARRVVRVMGCSCNADDRSAGHLCLRCEAREAIALAEQR